MPSPIVPSPLPQIVDGCGRNQYIARFKLLVDTNGIGANFRFTIT